MKFHTITHFTKQYCDFDIHRNVLYMAGPRLPLSYASLLQY